MLELNFDISDLLKRYEDLATEIERAATDGLAKLSLMTHVHITERAQEKLHSTRELFFSKFKPLEQVDPLTWLITIPKEISWIEDGINAGFDMLPGLLASPKAKTGADGKKFIIIPFKHNSPTRTPTQEMLTNTLRSELKKRQIPFQKIEKNLDGSPKSGLLHKLNAGNPTTPRPNGKPWQPDHYSGPILNKIRIYQHKQNETQGGQGAKRDIMTFRTATEKHSGIKWIHPGLEPQNFLTEAKDWAEKEWTDSILPEILKDLGI